MIRKMRTIFLLAFISLFSAAYGGKAQKVKVACVGNSITYGMTLTDRETESYPARLQQMLGEDYEVGNFGHSGTTLLRHGHRPYVDQVEFRQAMDFAGDIVVIHLGINDTDPRNWPNYQDEFVKDYLALIDSFQTVNPKCRVLIARLTPIAHRHHRFESGTRDWRDETQKAIEHVARLAGVQLIDFEAPLYPYPYILHDAIHPNAEGANILAQVVCSAITGNYGGLQMGPLYTDNMVLQRDKPLTISGMADVKSRVTVRIDGQKKSAVVGDDGKWQVVLDPLKAGGPYELKISDGTRTLAYKDVLVGEVWLCSGQSNMEFMLRAATTASQDVPKANDPLLRLYDMKGRWATNAVEWPESVLDSLNHLQYFFPAQWQPSTPQTAARFSAIAYYFGRMLRDSLQIPIGLICNAVGGSPTEAWIPRRTLEYEFPAILRQWTKNDFIQDWVRGRAALNIARSKDPLQRHPYEPCYLYESAILPIEGYPLRGVIWYQGESNAHNNSTHERLFGLLVDSWREAWNDASMPFLYVQLSSINRPSWPWFRDSQRRLMTSRPALRMAVSSDLGDSLDVHPRQKKPIGQRLALWALYDTYGHKAVTPSGPLFHSVDFSGEYALVHFDYGEGLHSSDGTPLRTFELAEEDGLFYPAEAEVTGPGILRLHSPQVPHPRYVRYAWQPFTRANLVNQVGLPASTFRSK